MDDTKLGAQPDFDAVEFLPEEPMDFALGPEAPKSDAGIGGSEVRRSRSPSTQKRVSHHKRV